MRSQLAKLPLLACALALHSAPAQTIVQSTFDPLVPVNLYSDPQNWRPQEVPNNSADKVYHVTISPWVHLDMDATISSLVANGGLVTEDHSLNVLGPTTMAPEGGLSIRSRGPGGATFRFRSLSSASDGKLTGRFSLENNAVGAGWATLQIDDANITELRAAELTLRGPMTRFIDAGGNDALRNLRLIDSSSKLVIVGRQFSTAEALTQDGALFISHGFDRPALFATSSTLTNYNPATRTLTGGEYYSGSLGVYPGADAPAVLQFPGADIVRNAAAIDLMGPLAKITDELGRDALRNLAHNTPGAFLRFTGADFTTPGDFRNDGTFTVASGKFVVSGELKNFDRTTNTLSGGTFTVGGYAPAELRFTGADIVRNAADLTIYRGSIITDESGNNALRNLAFNDAAGTLSGTFNPAGNFTNVGSVNVHEVTMQPGSVYLQTAGVTRMPGKFSGTMQINAGVLTGSREEANEVGVSGDVTIGAATLVLGQLYVKGSVTLGSQARVTVPSERLDAIYLNGPPGLRVDGPISLAGTLEIEDPGDFPPPSNAVFVPIQSTALTGAFANAPGGTRVPTKGGRGSYIVTYQNNGVWIGAYQRAEPAAQLLNISTRAKVGTGQGVTIGGFIIYGDFDSKKIVLRGMGPSLGSAGVAGALDDPAIELIDATGRVVARNDNWRENRTDNPHENHAEEISQTGLAPGDDREAALVATLQRGDYTIVLRGARDTEGMGLVEVYDLAPDSRSKLANISTRGFVDAGHPLIGGLISGGSGKGKAELTVRAIGPGLEWSNITDYLPDPALEVRDSNGSLVVENDDYSSAEANINTIAPALYPYADKDAATGLVVPAGQYTVVVRGKAGASGIALVEIYDLNR